MIRLPNPLQDIRYCDAQNPGAPRRDPSLGANCQVFAYLLLEHHGLKPPWLHSSDLWADRDSTTKVTDFAPLDLLLFHARPEAYGAHVTVYAGDGHVLHLAKHHGRPVYERVDDLVTQARYRSFIGAKRVKRLSRRPPASQFGAR